MHLLVPVSTLSGFGWKENPVMMQLGLSILNPPCQCQPYHIIWENGFLSQSVFAHNITIRVDFYILYAPVLHVCKITWALNKQPVCAQIFTLNCSHYKQVKTLYYNQTAPPQEVFEMITDMATTYWLQLPQVKGCLNEHRPTCSKRW